MIHSNKIVLAVAMLALTAGALPAQLFGKKKKVEKFHLNVEFVIGIDNYDKAKTRAWIEREIKHAERLFCDKPALDIHAKYVRKTKAGGRSLARMEFKNGREYGKFMDNYFDNVVGKKKTDGRLRVLVVNTLQIGTRKIGGRAWFPHCVVPFNRKHGISAQYGNDGVLAHELGHMLSLKHTFERYVGLKKPCNKDYKPKVKGNSKRKDGSYNVMDYTPDSFTTKIQSNGKSNLYLNKCQRDRAAKQRRVYMTNKGKTNYRKLKGLR